MTKETEAKWVERVREWRGSGLSAEEFAGSRGFEASTLRWAASQLRGVATSPSQTAPSADEVRTVRRRPRVARLAEAPRFLPVRTRVARAAVAELLVEVGPARVRVSRGFDVSLLGDVVRALAGGVR